MEHSKLVNYEFVGFWSRFFASIIDSFVMGIPLAIIFFILFSFGTDSTMITISLEHAAEIDTNSNLVDLFSRLAFMILTITLWLKWGGKTPGKALLNMKIISGKEETNELTLGQAVLRYVGYFLCVLTLGIGFLIVAFRDDKRGLHDIIANTYVVKDRPLVEEYKEWEKSTEE